MNNLIGNTPLIEIFYKFRGKENSFYANKDKIHVSYDIWEMHEGIHLYSLASIYSAFTCIIKIYKKAKNYNKILNASDKEINNKIIQYYAEAI